MADDGDAADEGAAFARALSRLDVSKLDRAEQREVEGLYREKEYLRKTLEKRLVELQSERDRLETRVDALERERDALRMRLEGADALRPTLTPDRVVASLGDSLADARADLAGVDYAVGEVTVDLKANVVAADDGLGLQLPDLDDPVDREALSSVRFSLRPGGGDDVLAYDPVPDVRDRSQSVARETIQRAGFVVGEVTARPGEVDDVVVEQFPSPHAVAEPGTPVDLTVSERREVSVPAVVGHTRKDALAALEDADLVVGEESAEAADAPPETVVGQDPAAGATVVAGTAVDLAVSSGPPRTDEEGDDDEDEAENDADSDADVSPTVDLESVSGIGSTYAGRLREAGIADAGALLDAEVERVAEAAETSPSRVERWLADATRRVAEAER
ncbi:MAG: PASTA domain-containing protein [Haloplanus sp.]